jgi:uncharacterized protein YjiS (DUF1127 family)
MSLINLLVSARHALADRRQRQRAYDELAALNDRELADIGLHRSQIPYVEGLHDAVQLDSASVTARTAAHGQDTLLSPTEQWLRRV